MKTALCRVKIKVKPVKKRIADYYEMDMYLTDIADNIYISKPTLSRIIKCRNKSITVDAFTARVLIDFLDIPPEELFPKGMLQYWWDIEPEAN